MCAVWLLRRRAYNSDRRWILAWGTSSLFEEGGGRGHEGQRWSWQCSEESCIFASWPAHEQRSVGILDGERAMPAIHAGREGLRCLG